jgi:hypothetical protein
MMIGPEISVDRERPEPEAEPEACSEQERRLVPGGQVRCQRLVTAQGC